MPLPTRYLLSAAVACALAAMVVLLAAYGWGPAANLDVAALHGFMSLDTPSVDRLAGRIALSMNVAPMLVILTALCLAGLAAGRSRQVVTALGVVAAANLTTQILKAVLAHPRFDAALGPVQPAAAAFPSGHATAVMSLAVAALIIAPRRIRPVVAALSAIYVLAVSLSVLILGWHFPSDVVGGMLVATGYGCLGLALMRTLAGGRAPTGSVSLSRPGTALEEWAAGALALALALALAVGIALARAGEIVGYARAHTATTATAMLVAALGASLLAGFASLARD